MKPNRTTLLVAVASVILLAAVALAQDPPETGQVDDRVQTEKTQPIAKESSRPEMERPTTWGEPTEVQVGIYVIDVDEVDSAQQNFAASIFYEVRWKSPFLIHEGPGPLHRNISEIWNPQLIIVNQQMAWRAFPEAVDIYPDGEVHYQQKVWARFSQPLDLHDFPMDSQTLSIHLLASGVTQGEVKMVPLELSGHRSSGITRQFSLPDWEVISWDAKPQTYSPFEEEAGVPGFELRIEVDRRLPYWVTKVIFPLCLIVIMSWLPFWIDPEQIGTNIGIATTSFLTLVAYLFAIGALLPQVSYITRIDRFILLSTIMVFASLMQTVAHARLVKNDKVDLARRNDRWSRVGYAVALVIILVVSFVV